VSARYYVLVSQDLLDDPPDWGVLGLRLVEQGGFTEPGMRWCLFEDDGAPGELDGCRVELTLTSDGTPGGTRITERNVVS
jgi:catechol 2,3-dioxygenase-like lactoylglutathione lyase family enzyme